MENFKEQGANKLALVIPARKVDIIVVIQNRVLSGEWGLGSQLPSERELATEYGVSRPVIREALAGLVELGFIEIHPGRGSYVRGVRTDDLSGSLNRAATLTKITARDLVAARLGLECTAAELAAKESPRPVEAIQRALIDHSEAETIQSLADTDLAFHETIVAASGNPLLVVPLLDPNLAQSRMVKKSIRVNSQIKATALTATAAQPSVASRNIRRSRAKRPALSPVVHALWQQAFGIV